MEIYRFKAQYHHNWNYIVVHKCNNLCCRLSQFIKQKPMPAGLQLICNGYYWIIMVTFFLGRRGIQNILEYKIYKIYNITYYIDVCMFLLFCNEVLYYRF